MKRILSLLLCAAMLLTGCTAKPASDKTDDNVMESSISVQSELPDDVIRSLPIEPLELSYAGLGDETLLRRIEDAVYAETVRALNSDEYVVESVTAVYISKEYIDEALFNSQPNVYFGYTLSELNEVFQGTKYVFTLGEDGETTVKELLEIEDESEKTIMKNVLIGTGVILVCVVVSVVSYGAGAPACAAIFAASAKTGAIMAVSGAAMGGISAGIVRGVQTGDMTEALKAGALAGSDGYKWGAISGACIGGGKEVFALKAGTKSGLTMNEVATIQKESELPMDIISEFHSKAEYEVYNEAKLRTFMVSGKTALIQDIDLDYVSELNGKKVTNLVRMQSGQAPYDPTGKAYELHHVGQNNDGTLAILNWEQHRGTGNNTVLHTIFSDSGVDHGAKWAEIKRDFWKSLGNMYALGMV